MGGIPAGRVTFYNLPLLDLSAPGDKRGGLRGGSSQGEVREEETEQNRDGGAEGRADREKKHDFKDEFRFSSGPGERQGPGGAVEGQTAEDSGGGQDQVGPFSRLQLFNPPDYRLLLIIAPDYRLLLINPPNYRLILLITDYLLCVHVFI